MLAPARYLCGILASALLMGLAKPLDLGGISNPSGALFSADGTFLIFGGEADGGALYITNVSSTAGILDSRRVMVEAAWITTAHKLHHPALWGGHVYFIATTASEGCVGRANYSGTPPLIAESPVVCASETPLATIDEATVFGEDPHLALRSGNSIWVSPLEDPANATRIATIADLASFTLARRDALLYLLVSQCASSVDCSLKYLSGTAAAPLSPFVDTFGRTFESSQPTDLIAGSTSGVIAPGYLEVGGISSWRTGSDSQSEVFMSTADESTLGLSRLSFDAFDRPFVSGKDEFALVGESGEVDVNQFTLNTSIGVMRSTDEDFARSRNCWFSANADVNCGDGDSSTSTGIGTHIMIEMKDSADEGSEGILISANESDAAVPSVPADGDLMAANETAAITSPSNGGLNGTNGNASVASPTTTPADSGPITTDESSTDTSATSTDPEIPTNFVVTQYETALYEKSDGSRHDGLKKYDCTTYDPVEHARVICHVPNERSP